MPSNILLADDDLQLSAMLKAYLSREGFVVSTVADGQAAAEETMNGKYDLVVLDVMMPRVDGIEALRRIRKASRIPVIMLTARGDDVDRILGLELGADDYVPKPCTPRELTARIRAILRRIEAPAGGAGPIEGGPVVVWPQNRRAECRGKTLDLTSTEFNVLEVLVRNAGRVVTKKQISEAALGRPLARFDRSIDVHVSSLRHKLGADAMIHTVRGMGYQIGTE